MNKIYKVVWNAARGCFVVDSEFIRSSHTGGCGCEQKRSGCTLKRAVLTALLAGGILLPLSGAQVSAAWWGDYGPATNGNKNTLEHEQWQDAQIKDLQGNQQDVSGLKGDVSDLQDDVSHLESAFENSAKKDHEQDADIGGLKDDVSGLKDDVSGLQEGVSGLKEDMAANDLRDTAQDGRLDGMADWNKQQDAAIEMGKQWDEKQNSQINDLQTSVTQQGADIDSLKDDMDREQQMNWSQQGEINNLNKENAMQQSQINGLEKENDAQWGAIGHNYEIDKEQGKDIANLKDDMEREQQMNWSQQGEINNLNKENAMQQSQINGLEKENDAQWGAIGHNYEIDKEQGKDIANLKDDMEREQQMNWSQQGEINNLNKENAMQQSQINGLEKENDAQWGAIGHNYEIDKEQGKDIANLKDDMDREQQMNWSQQGEINNLNKENAMQQGQINDLKDDMDREQQMNWNQQGEINDLKGDMAANNFHDAMQDGAIIGGIIKDKQQDEALKQETAEREEADKTLGEGLSQLGSDLVDEVTKREEGDKQLQSQIDDVNDKVGDADFADTTYADGAGNVTDAIKDLDDALGEVDYKAQQHTTVTTSDSNIQMSESTNANGGTNYDLALNPNLKVETVQAESGAFGDIQINGKDENGNATNTITGLGNTEWDANHDYTGSTQAATESQLQQAIDQTATELTNNSVQYDKNADGSVNKGSVTLGGTGSAPVHLGNVEDGHVAEGSKDAVNGGQLWNVQQQVNDNTSAISGLNSRVDTLDGRIDKVGANAAALAALHPLDFDPDDKWDFAAGVGNYGGENAMAVGAFYRPNEDTMFSVGGSFGTGENMVNAGVSFKIGQGNHVSTSRVAMAKEIETLRHNVAQLTELVNRLVGSQDQIQNAMTTPFPDVPENHWAYETIEQMRERGIVEGYPDGTFGGDRQMTRYEFATIVYRAMQKGIGMNEDIQRLVEEFKPELELIRVDTIAQDSEGRPTIERVRVNKA